MTNHATTLRQAIDTKTATVGIVGMGYVGLPLALAFVYAGFTVTGFDIDPAKPQQLSAGKSYFSHITPTSVSKAVATGRFDATNDFSRLADMDAIILCVPTPLDANNSPDLSYVVDTTKTVAEYLRPGQLISLESTTYPGTTREVVRPLLEQAGLQSGRDFFLAYSPEREDPGSQGHSTAVIPKLVGGDGETALSLANALYGHAVAETVPVSSVDVAEAAKLTENIFRSVNIALVNELKLVYDKMGIDIWEVIDAAKTKPFGFMPFYPGPGLGGHCIPIDPFYLSWRAREVGTETRFIELAGEINTAMPTHVVATTERALRERFGKSLNGAHVLLLGVAYKKNVDDVRESPAFALIELLEAAGAIVDFHDPFVPEMPRTREHFALAGRRSMDIAPDRLAAYDCALICTDHEDVDYETVAVNCRLIVDTRNVMKTIDAAKGKTVKA